MQIEPSHTTSKLTANALTKEKHLVEALRSAAESSRELTEIVFVLNQDEDVDFEEKYLAGDLEKQSQLLQEQFYTHLQIAQTFLPSLSTISTIVKITSHKDIEPSLYENTLDIINSTNDQAAQTLYFVQEMCNIISRLESVDLKEHTTDVKRSLEEMHTNLERARIYAQCAINGISIIKETTDIKEIAL